VSGGSYNYAYSNVSMFVDSLERNDSTPLRKAFAKHLKKVVKAMHDIEWVDSGDYGEGDEEKAIKAVLGKDTKHFVLSELKEQLDAIQKELEVMQSETD